MLPRPRMCPEPRCQPLVQHPYTPKGELKTRDFEPGESWICFGTMTETIIFDYDGIAHANDCRSCSFTPLKGLVAWQENKSDWALMASLYREALGELEKCLSMN